jgi:hypothetical protein
MRREDRHGARELGNAAAGRFGYRATAYEAGASGELNHAAASLFGSADNFSRRKQSPPGGANDCRSLAPAGRVSLFSRAPCRRTRPQTTARASGGVDRPRLGSHFPRRRTGPVRAVDTKRSPPGPSVVTAAARPIAEASRLFIASAAVDRPFPQLGPRRARTRWGPTAPRASTA